jgi:hypothetical protein
VLHNHAEKSYHNCMRLTTQILVWCTLYVLNLVVRIIFSHFQSIFSVYKQHTSLSFA